MNEREWQDRLKGCSFLPGKSNPRRLQLFLCACTRRVCHIAQDERCEQALAVAERFADGRATAQEQQEAAAAAAAVCAQWDLRVSQAGTSWPDLQAAFAAHACRQAVLLDLDAAEHAVHAVADRQAERSAQGLILDDIFSLPFPMPVLQPSWLTANGGEVSRLARASYEANRFEDLPVLADALQRAGCSDRVLLSHGLAPHEHGVPAWILEIS